MTLVAAAPAELSKGAPAAGTAATDLAPHRRSRLPDIVGFVTVAWFLFEVPRSTGGRGAGVVSIGALSLIGAVIALWPHRVLPRLAVPLAAAVSAGALVVPLVAPTGWPGAATGASYVIAAWLTVVVAALVARSRRALPALLVLITAAGLVEFAQAWFPWWGGEDPGRAMIGTFYWHNPYGAFLLPPALLGLALWLRCRRWLASLGLAAFTFGCVGVLYSTSRASLACLGVGAVLLAAAALVSPGRVRTLTRVATAVGVAVTTSYVIGGPPFFPHRELATAAIAGRTAGQSLAQNGGYRLQFWHEALHVFWHHPFTGGGYHSMVAESAGRVPQDWALSPFAHNGYLQALSDGGLLLGLPFLAAVLAVIVVAARLLWRSASRRQFGLGGFAVPLVLAGLLAHSAVDFDWSYPADLALAAVLAGLAVGFDMTHRPAVRQPRPRAAGLTVVAAAGVALAIAAVAARHGDMTQNLPVHGGFGTSAIKAPAISADTDHDTSRASNPSLSATRTR